MKTLSVAADERGPRRGDAERHLRVLLRQIPGAERSRGDFPAPVSHLNARTRLWRWPEGAAWAQRHDKPIDLTTAVAAVNAALTLRKTLGDLAPPKRKLVTPLV